MEVTKFLVEEDTSKRLRDYRELVEKLFVLRDRGSYDDYFLQFVEMVMPFERFFTPGYEEIVEEELMYFFVEGLQKETKLYVYELGPKGLLDAMNMACYYEYVVTQERINEEEDLELKKKKKKMGLSSAAAVEEQEHQLQDGTLVTQIKKSPFSSHVHDDGGAISEEDEKTHQEQVVIPDPRLNLAISKNWDENRSNIQEFKEDGDYIITSPVLKDNTKKQFRFDRVFNPKDDQDVAFVETLPVVKSVLDEYNVCIFDYGQTGTGRTEQALNILEEMTRNRFKPVATSYNPIIARFCKEGKLDTVLKCIDMLMHRHCAPNEGTYNAIVVLCREGKVGEAFYILQNLGNKQNSSMHDFNRNVISFLCKKGNTYAVFQLLNVMTKNGFTPDSYTNSSLIRGLCMEGMLDEAIEIFEVMVENDYRPDIDNYNALNAQKLFDEMPKRDVFPWAILIDGYEKIDGDIHGARELFDNVREKNVLIFDLGGGYIALPLAEIPRPVTTVTDRPSISALTNYLYNVLVHLEKGFGVILPSKRSLPKPLWSYLKSSFCRTPSVTTSSRPSPKPPD